MRRSRASVFVAVFTALILLAGGAAPANAAPPANAVAVSAPTIDTPGGRVQTTVIELSGNATPGATVHLKNRQGGSVKAVADTGGRWRTPLTIHEGDNRITAYAEADGHTSAESPERNYRRDTTSPSPRFYSFPDVSTKSRPYFSVLVDPPSTAYLSIVETNQEYSVQSTGESYYQPKVAPLTDGTYTVRLRAVDDFGRASKVTERQMRIDTTGPGAPTISAPVAGGSLTTATPTISGKTDPGAPVVVEVDGASLETRSDGSGAWSVTPGALADGEHTAKVYAKDELGNHGETAGITFHTDATAPGAPIIHTPQDGTATTDTTPDVQGRAVQGEKVMLSIEGTTIDGQPVKATAEAPAGPEGSWATAVPEALPDGTYTVTSEATDQHNRTGPKSDAVQIEVDTKEPAPPTMGDRLHDLWTGNDRPTLTGTAEPFATVRISVGDQVLGTATADENGHWTLNPPVSLRHGRQLIAATATDNVGLTSKPSDPANVKIDLRASPPEKITPADGSSVNDPTPTITVKPGPETASLEVTLTGPDNTVVTLPGTIGSDGVWTYTPSEGLASGSHTIDVTATDNTPVSPNTATGKSTFTMDTTAPASPAIAVPGLDALLNDSTPAVSGTGAEADAQITVTATPVEQTDTEPTTSTTTVGTDGTWSTDTQKLSDGKWQVSAVATDAAGNESVPSIAVPFTVDTAAPSKPAIVSPSTPTVTKKLSEISGTADSGTTVTVRNGTAADAAIIGTAAVAVENGNWSVAVSEDLKDDVYSLVATSVDLAGNPSASDAVSLTIDNVSPEKPSIRAPADNAETNDVTPEISGEAEENTTIEVFADEVSIGSTRTSSEGTWTFTPTTDLATGTRKITATAKDAAGNTSDPSAVTTVLIDIAASNAPSISTPSTGDVLNTKRPVISGAADADVAEVSIRAGEREIGRAPVTDRAWSLTPAADIADGKEIALSAIAFDKAGNESPASTSVTITIDTAAPAAPTIGYPGEGATIKNPSLTITGSATGDADTVTVTIDGNEAGMVDVAAEAWSFPVSESLAQGPHTISVTATDAAGNIGEAGTSSFSVDTEGPGAPLITAPDADSTTKDTTVTIAGTAEAGVTVSLRLGTEPSDTDTHGPVDVDVNGNWTLTPPALAEGSYTVIATATDQAGNRGKDSAPRSFVLDTTPPAITVTDPADGSYLAHTRPPVTGSTEAGATVTVTATPATATQGDAAAAVNATATVDGDGTWTATFDSELGQGEHRLSVVAVDPAGNASDEVTRTFTVDTVAPTNEASVALPPSGVFPGGKTPTITGTAHPGDLVQITIDGTLVDAVTADADGGWTYTASTQTEGEHKVIVTVVDRAGNQGPVPAAVTFTVDVTAPTTPTTITTPQADSYVTDRTPTIGGTAEAGASIQLDVRDSLNFSHVTAQPPAHADTETGNWAVNLNQELKDGRYTVTARAVDAAGNTGSYSDAVHFTIDGTTPNAPVVQSPSTGEVVATRTPTISGLVERGAPEDTVSITIGEYTADARVASDGTWSHVVDAAAKLADGDQLVTATAKDKAGNTSEASVSVPFVMDTTAPSAPAISAPQPNEVLNQATPAITGTAPGADSVTITLAGVTEEVPVTEGAWTHTPATALTDGPYQVSVVANDAYGNASAPVSTDFTIDTTAPVKPVVSTPTQGALITDNTPPIAGTAEEVARVSVSVNGTPVEVDVTDAQWSYTPTTALPEGPNTVAVTSTDAAGNPATSEQITFTVDTTSPQGLTITSPGELTNEPTPTIAGSVEAGADVFLLIDGASLELIELSESEQNWEHTPKQPLNDGPHTVSVTAMDAAGNKTTPPVELTFTVDTIAPVPTVDAPATGALINTKTPQISGTTEADSTVQVTIGEAKYTPTVEGTTWSFTPTTDLAEGENTISVTATDTAGNATVPAVAHTIVVDTTAPGAPVVASPAAGEQVNTQTPEIAGTTEDGTSVSVMVAGQTKDATVSGTTWTVTMDTPLEASEQTVTATAEDAAGNPATSAHVTFSVDLTPPAKPVISAPTNGSQTNDPTPTLSGSGETGSTVTVAVDAHSETIEVVDGSWTSTVSEAHALGDGSHTASVVAEDPAGNTATGDSVTFVVDTALSIPTVDSPTADSFVNTGVPEIRGTADEGATVTVTVDDQTVDSALVTVAGGAWSYTPSTVLGEGLHTVKVAAQDAANNTAESTVTTFTVDTTRPDAPSILAPADGALLADSTPEISGTLSGEVTLTLVLDEATPVSVVPGLAGTWSYTPSAPLDDGAHTVKVTATDRAGNATDSAVASFQTDASAPGAPTITAPAPDAFIASKTPVISGTTDAATTVSVSIDGASVAATVDGTSWSVTSTELAEGTHSIVATASDLVGNSVSSAAVGFTVDTVKPGVPAYTSPKNGDVLAADVATISGTTEAGTAVTVTIGNGAAQPATVDGENWTFTPTTPLGEGEYSLSTVASDRAGLSSDAGTISFRVDKSAPEPVTIATPTPGQWTNDATPTIAGEGEPGATVTVSVNDIRSTFPVAEDKSWAHTVPSEAALPDGTYTAVITQSDAAGNTSSDAKVTFTVDTAAPDAPVFSSPTEGDAVNTAVTAIEGTVEADAAVWVSVDGADPVAATVTGTTWTLNLAASPLNDGRHTVQANATDAAGNESTSPSSIAFSVDTKAAPAPAFVTPRDGDVLNAPVAEITGTTEEGSTVQMSINEGAAVAATVTGTTWTVSLDPALADGTHTASAIATDAVGNPGAASTLTFTVDTATPDAPTFTAPADGSFVNTDVKTITGKAEPGTRVQLFVANAEPASRIQTRQSAEPIESLVSEDGTWSATLPASLDVGTYTATAKTTDDAGNISSEATTTFTVDKTIPDAPAITAPTAGVVPAEVSVIQGTAEEFARVLVTVGTGDPVAAEVTGTAWSLTLDPALSDGEHTVSAVAIDRAGNPSEASVTAFRVDTKAPDAPVFTSPLDGDLLQTQVGTISGTTEAGVSVAVTISGIDGALPATVDGENWTLQLSDPLRDGTYEVTAVATDQAGHAGAPATITFTVDTLAPTPPGIVSPSADARINDATPTISGTGETGSEVAITVGDIAEKVRVVDGNWSITVADAAALAEGGHEVTARSTDAAGNISGPTTSSFTVDYTPPAAPKIVAPADGSATQTSPEVISGTTEEGSSVSVRIGTDDVAAEVTGTDWSYTAAPGTFAEGEHTVSAVATDGAGNPGARATVSFTVDASAPVAPVVTSPESGASVSDTTPTFTGTAEEGSTVTVKIGSRTGRALLDGGSWTYIPDPALDEGTHTLTVTSTDAAGNVTEAEPVTFTVDIQPAEVPVLTRPEPGSEHITNQPSINGTGEAGTTVNVIIDGGLAGTAPVDAEGNWVFETAALSDATHSLSISATDAAGNTSESTTPIVFVVDATAPDAPVVSVPQHGESIADTTPDLAGHAEVDSLVDVQVDGTPVGTVRTDPRGSWSLTLPEQSEGVHTVTATATDAAGNVSETSAPSEFTVDTTAPTGVVAEYPEHGSSLSTTEPTVSGTATPGTTITVVVTEAGTAPAAESAATYSTTTDEAGNWSITLPPQEDNTYTVEVLATDQAGNTTVIGEPVTLQIDSTVPGIPIIDPAQFVDGDPQVITGSAEPGVTVQLELDGKALASVTADQAGAWSFRVSPGLGEGEYTLKATAVDAAGNSSGASEPLTVTVSVAAASGEPDPVVPVDPEEPEHPESPSLPTKPVSKQVPAVEELPATGHAFSLTVILVVFVILLAGLFMRRRPNAKS